MPYMTGGYRACMGTRLIASCCLADLHKYAGFHTEEGPPWDFPSPAKFPPSGIIDSTIYFVLVSPSQSDWFLPC